MLEAVDDRGMTPRFQERPRRCNLCVIHRRYAFRFGSNERRSVHDDDGMRTWADANVQKSQAPTGASVIEVRKTGDRRTVVRPSAYARRVTAATPITISGPAALR
jgi:secreted PhoX family phosphatase